jgi:hypothetical protein
MNGNISRYAEERTGLLSGEVHAEKYTNEAEYFAEYIQKKDKALYNKFVSLNSN